MISDLRQLRSALFSSKLICKPNGAINNSQFRALSDKVSKSSPANGKKKVVDDKFLDETVKKLNEQQNEANSEKRSLLIKIGIGGAALFLIFLGYLRQKRCQKKMLDNNIMTRPETKADIGGPFEMTDHNGNKVTDKDFKGKWIVYYFGFTHCPDICPEELEKIANLVKNLKKNKKTANIVPIFVTVDPERDDIPAVKEYIAKFSDDFIGLTGSQDDCAKMAKTFRIFYSKGDHDNLGNYQVDHSIVSYLFDPNGEFVDFFHKRDSVGRRIEKCTSYIKNFKQ